MSRERNMGSALDLGRVQMSQERRMGSGLGLGRVQMSQQRHVGSGLDLGSTKCSTRAPREPKIAPHALLGSLAEGFDEFLPLRF